MNKNIYSHKLLLLFFITICLSCKVKQISILDKKIELIFKVEFENNKYFGYNSSAYVLISPEKIDSFKIYDDTIYNSPNIIYNIVCNGGLYISQSFSKLYTLGCCEYNDIEKAVIQNLDGLLPKDKLDKYSLVEKLSTDILIERKGINFKFHENNVFYKVTVWSIELDYCECNMYMESPSQHILDKKAAYINNIKSIKKPSKNMKKKIELILKNLILFDKKYY